MSKQQSATSSNNPNSAPRSGSTPKEAAHTLGITGKALRRAIRKGKLTAVKASGRWYISSDALAAYKVSREAKVEEVKATESN